MEPNQPERAEDLLKLFHQRGISIGLGNNDSEIVFPKLEHGMTRSITEDKMMTPEQRAKADGLMIAKKDIRRGLQLDSPSPPSSSKRKASSPLKNKSKKKKQGGKRRKRKTKKTRKKRNRKKRTKRRK
jgi:hypothetical protein